MPLKIVYRAILTCNHAVDAVTNRPCLNQVSLERFGGDVEQQEFAAKAAKSFKSLGWDIDRGLCPACCKLAPKPYTGPTAPCVLCGGSGEMSISGAECLHCHGYIAKGLPKGQVPAPPAKLELPDGVLGDKADITEEWFRQYATFTNVHGPTIRSGNRYLTWFAWGIGYYDEDTDAVPTHIKTREQLRAFCFATGFELKEKKRAHK